MTPQVVEKPHKTVVLQVKRWHVLEVLAKAYGWSVFVEVGVFRGWTSLHLLQNVPGLSVIGVDAYKQPEGPRAEVYPEDMDALYRTVSELFTKHGGDLRRADSRKAASWFAGLADAVFIDADHRTPNVIADIDAWLPKVRQGGWLLGHDWHHGSVRSAVKAKFENPVVFPDNVWGVRR